MRLICGAVLAALLLAPAAATAQDPAAQPQPAPAPAPLDPRDVADRRPNFVEPDFTLINLPTTLRLPRYKSAFRITRGLQAGDLPDERENDGGRDGPRRGERPRLVPRLQYLEEVLLVLSHQFSVFSFSVWTDTEN